MVARKQWQARLRLTFHEISTLNTSESYGEMIRKYLLTISIDPLQFEVSTNFNYTDIFHTITA